LWVAGEGGNEEFTKVSELTKTLGLSGVVSWLGLRRDMPDLFDAADGYVLSSIREGMPLALGEAMAMEKTVVATDVGGVRELVGEAGSVVMPRAPDALAMAMLDIMNMPVGDRNRMGRRARERIQASFGMDAKADEWEALYRTATGKR
jgi:glycosyltransferase involved in cell wall biosynthesis